MRESFFKNREQLLHTLNFRVCHILFCFYLGSNMVSYLLSCPVAIELYLFFLRLSFYNSFYFTRQTTNTSGLPANNYIQSDFVFWNPARNHNMDLCLIRSTVILTGVRLSLIIQTFYNITLTRGYNGILYFLLSVSTNIQYSKTLKRYWYPSLPYIFLAFPLNIFRSIWQSIAEQPLNMLIWHFRLLPQW